MSSETPDAGDVVLDLAYEFVATIYDSLVTAVTRFRTNFYASFANVSLHRWLRIGAIVASYVMLRPYIDLMFRKWFDHDQRKKKEKEEAQKAAFGVSPDKKANMSANALRGGGKVLGEVEESDEEVEDDEAKASGVPEWGKLAKKRQKKYQKSVEKESQQPAPALTDEQMMELLDWSDSEEDRRK